MKLQQIDPQRPEPTPSETPAGMKVKSHVKAGLSAAVIAPPRLPGLPQVGRPPIFVCG